ncbi:toll/interleukin-1 receptor domain-containing protein [Marinospirillum alkaliphilum]|uniref:TIR domain-containing protein n=1 Tax=Marinospirillum alkaliphilum DSM 21637 TaxID=1122209 RepID=A0A1K1TMK6_9GAMM|nr:toll/interleukin-1 receptor domain-containing protein [Marinospirillum alkaliphilum]SFX01187.1 TIR domain-containing protein [Marinospirillum alkaliphilum DSM 21637]
MTVKVFISYSHKDEEFKNSLTEHLSGLLRSGVISEWNDRKIVPGTNWSNEISENLKDSDLILFLISSSFLSSDYCVNIEAETALSMHKSGEAQLIPIVIRSVDWSDTPLSELQGLPKDAQPVALWPDRDEAWVNVIHGIKKNISEFKPKKNAGIKLVDSGGVHPTESILDWIDDTEIMLTHRKVNRIKLSDIYTIPDVEIDSEPKNELRTYRSACFLPGKFERFLVFGEEQQGKTSLLKYYYKSFLAQSKIPLILEGGSVKDSNPEVIIKKELARQYCGVSYEFFISSNDKVVIIDNIDDIGLNRKYRDKFITEICNLSGKCIFTHQLAFSLLIDEIPALDDFAQAEIMGLGNKKREEIIQRWISLGVEQTITEEDLYTRCDELKDTINSVVKKNIVPPKPIYILMLLQMFEAHTNLNLELSSHGHCYQQLIYQSFENAKINKRDFDKYLNVLTELAWWIFVNNKNPNEAQLDEFFEEYCKLYLDVDKEVVISRLSSHSILQVKEFKTGFKYPYIYYFFVGKKISESYLEYVDIQDKVSYLLDNLHREDFANILIFVAHHTKDGWVINLLKKVLSELFDEHPSATLDTDQLSFMNDFMRQIPELILEQREVQKERDAYNEKLDVSERSQSDEDEFEYPGILADINKTFKGMEIAGQIIRNRHASLKRDSLNVLAENGINAGLRFLKYFIAMSDIAKNEIVKVISSHLSENPRLTNDEIEKYAENAYLHLTYGVINSVVRKIAASVGSKEAMEIYRSIEEKEPTPALLLLKQSIELHFLKRIDIKSIAKSVEKLKGNFVCTRILKELVIQHIYMFPVDYKEKQQLSRLLGLSVKGQQLMEQKQKRIG